MNDSSTNDRPGTEQATAHAPAQAPASGTVTRRRFLGGAATALGLGAVGLARMDSVVAQTRASELNRAGAALQPAVRVDETTTAPASTVPASTSTVSATDTVPQGSTPPPADGEILFPIIVDGDDDCYVIDNFGDCRGSGCSRSHEGVDIMADHLLPVRTPAPGRLTKMYVDSGLTYGAGNGWTLYDETTDITWKFFHLDSHEDGLDVDDEVEPGQIIGYVGNTGTSGVGFERNYHLHLEYRPGNVAADSFDLLERDPNVTFES